jgi:hypothetical protein
MDMDFSWLKGLQKAAWVAGVVALGSLVASFFGSFDEVVEWEAVGAPQFVVPLAIMGVEFARNFIKQWLKSLGPDA